MDNKKIERINALSKKGKTQGLTPGEQGEQAALRAEYIAAFRKNLKGQLDQIVITEQPSGADPLDIKKK